MFVISLGAPGGMRVARHSPLGGGGNMGGEISWSDAALVRLERLGARALTDDELVAVLCGAKTLDQTRALMSGGLRGLLLGPADVLLEDRRLSRGAAARLLVVAELSRRLAASAEQRPRLTTPHRIVEWVRAELWGAAREEVHVLCLNSRNVLLRHARVSDGAADQCPVDPREVFGPAVVSRASNIVLVHNHPSGDPEPSSMDLALTRRLDESARVLCIRLLDHIIIGHDSFTSLLMTGALDPSPERMSMVQSP